MHIAQGSIAELETQILISQELGFVKVDSVNSLLQEMDEISKMIIGLQRSLKTVTSNKSVVTRKKEVED